MVVATPLPRPYTCAHCGQRAVVPTARGRNRRYCDNCPLHIRNRTTRTTVDHRPRPVVIQHLRERRYLAACDTDDGDLRIWAIDHALSLPAPPDAVLRAVRASSANSRTSRSAA